MFEMENLELIHNFNTRIHSQLTDPQKNYQLAKSYQVSPSASGFSKYKSHFHVTRLNWDLTVKPMNSSVPVLLSSQTIQNDNLILLMSTCSNIKWTLDPAHVPLNLINCMDKTGPYTQT